MGLCRQHRLGRALPLSQRRYEGARRCRGDCREAADRPAAALDARRRLLARTARRCSCRSAPPSNVAEDMPKLDPAELQKWIAENPLGAAWGNESERADVLVFDPHGKNRRIFATGIRNCVGMAIHPDDRRSLVLDQRTRSARRRSAARLRHARARRRVLRLALVLYRRQPGPASQRRTSQTCATRSPCPTC